MITAATSTQRINLLPGELVIVKNGETVWTVLGSCIAVIFYNKRLNISAVCHAQLPSKTFEAHCSESCISPCGQDEMDDFKYVSCSIKYMLTSFQKLGIRNNEIDVRLYGGSNMLGLGSEKPRIGEKNIAVAKQLIKENDLTISSEDIRGYSSRAITHYSDLGMTKVKTNDV